MPHVTQAKAKAAAKLKGAKAAAEGERGIFRKLQEEHVEVATLMKQIASDSDLGIRRKLFVKVKRELLAHARAEEKEFYSMLEHRAETRSLTAQSIDDHCEIEDLLEELDLLPYDDETWDDVFGELMERVEKHVDEEENQLFPAAQKIISADDAKQIEQRFTRQKSSELKKAS
jgi:hemerythrin superfamily protein